MEKNIKLNFVEEILKESIKNPDGNVWIFTDIDGTLTLSPLFKHAVIRTKNRLGVLFIANTGRTPKDIEGMLNREKIPTKVFDDILGNNGATSKYYKSYLPPITVNEILCKYLELGGDSNDIRLVNDNILIPDDEGAKRHYDKDKGIVKISDDILKEANGQINKITLVGEERIIDLLIEYIESRGYKCNIHKGNSKYRASEKEKYRSRIDVTSSECSKATILEKVAKKFEIKSFVVMGNDENDIAMFKSAIDNGGYIVLVGHEDKEITRKIMRELEEYAKQKGKKLADVNLMQIKPEEMNNFLQLLATRKRFKKEFLERIRVNGASINKKTLPPAKRKAQSLELRDGR